MMTAFESDSQWLANNGLYGIDIEKFSDWVTRLVGDGMLEQQAREFVFAEMKL